MMRGYKKKKIEKSILLSVLAGALLLGTAAHAENVTYTGRGMFGTDPQDAWHGASVYSDKSWNDNTVTITGVIDTSKLYDVRGGTAKTYKPYNLDDTSGNTVMISDSTFGRRNTTSTNGVYGGYSGNDGAVNYNHVIITAKSNITAEYVEGGRSYGSGKVIGNDVLIDGGSIVTVNGVYGGDAGPDNMFDTKYDMEVRKNTVTVEGEDTKVNAGVYGGGIYLKATGVIENNEVNIKGGTIYTYDEEKAVWERVAGGYSEKGMSDVLANKVNISGGTITGDVYGGFVDKDESIADSGSGKVAENCVNISGGEIEGDVYGGRSSGGDLNGNEVVISAKVKGKIYGAYAEDLLEGASVADNTVTLLKGANVEEADIYGAHIESGKAGSGNALLVDGWQGTVNSLHDLDEIVFKCLPWQDGGTVLSIADGDNSDLSDTAVSVDRLTLENGRELGVGKKMTLLERKDGLELKVKDDDVTIDEFTAGTSLRGTLEHRKENNKLVVEIESLESQRQNEPLAEARAMALSFVNVSEDLIHEALDGLGRDREEGIKTFALVSGTESTYDLGNGLKLNGWSFLTGIDEARRIGKDDEELNVTLFFETGTGNYRLYNTFYDAAGSATHFRGDGSMSYNGGGSQPASKKRTAFILKEACGAVF